MLRRIGGREPLRSLVAIVTLLSALVAAPSRACHCAARSITTALAADDALFVGERQPGAPTALRGTEVPYAVRVTRVFRGDVAPLVMMLTDTADCGLLPPPGEPWLFVVLHEHDDGVVYKIGECDGSKAVSDLTGAELAALPPPHAPHTCSLGFSAVVVLIVGVLCFLFIRRFHRAVSARRA